MELIIVFIVITFLIGTISLAVPSKSSRRISNLRMEASRLGFKIIPSNLSTLSFKNKDFSLACYHFKNETNIKEAHFIRDKDELILYSPLKLKYSDEYDGIKIKLNKLSLCVHEVIYSKTLIAFLWEEKAGLDELKNISNSLKDL
jgi:hypothetical protein